MLFTNGTTPPLMNVSISHLAHILDASIHVFLRCIAPTLVEQPYVSCKHMYKFCFVVLHVDEEDDDSIYNNTLVLLPCRKFYAMTL